MDTRTTEQRSRIMAAVPQRHSRPELAIRRALHAAGYRYRLHARNLPGTPDIVFPARKKVVFVHGCFWHGHRCSKGRLPKSREDYWHTKITTNKKRDRRTERALRRIGWRSLVVWQCEVKEPITLLQRMRRFLAS